MKIRLAKLLAFGMLTTREFAIFFYNPMSMIEHAKHSVRSSSPRTFVRGFSLWAGMSAFIFCTLLLLTGTSFAASTECDLSLPPGVTGACPVGGIGAASTNSTYTGATIDAKSDGHSAIDAFGYCRYLGNGGPATLFVPFGDVDEWHAYLTNHPSTVYLIQCSRGGTLIMPANFGKDGASNMCAGPPAAQSIVVPYQPANVPGDFMPPPIIYTCHSADGTEFNETVTARLTSHDSGYGPSDDIGWTYSKVLYKYDGVCGAARGVPVSVAPTKNLCHVGMANGVIGSGPYTWICMGGTGGGKNASCSTDVSCAAKKVDEKPCRCEEGNCYRPIYWDDGCGHSWIDKSQTCDKPEPLFNPQVPSSVDDTNK